MHRPTAGLPPSDRRRETTEAQYSDAYARYLLVLLFVCYVFNFIDRQILAILLQPIKEELGASDTAMGLLTGIAFALFYTFAGIPIARLADRGVRRSIIAGGLTVWRAALHFFLAARTIRTDVAGAASS